MERVHPIVREKIFALLEVGMSPDEIVTGTSWSRDQVEWVALYRADVNSLPPADPQMLAWLAQRA